MLNILVAPFPAKRLVLKDVVLGPDIEGVAKEKYTQQWKLGWADSTLKLYKVDSVGNLIDTTPLAPFPQLIYGNVSNLSLAFDQAGRNIIAWEENNQLYIRQYDLGVNGYSNRGPFAGHDPIIYSEKSASRTNENSNLLLFYLSANRKTLKYRKQNDLYLIEYVLETYEDEKELTGISTGTFQYHIALGENEGDIVFNSDLYPYLAKDILLITTGQPSSSLLDNVVSKYDDPDSESILIETSQPSPSYYENNLIITHRVSDLLDIDTTEPQKALLDSVVVVYLINNMDAIAINVTQPGQAKLETVTLGYLPSSPESLTISTSAPTAARYGP